VNQTDTHPFFSPGEKNPRLPEDDIKINLHYKTLQLAQMTFASLNFAFAPSSTAYVLDNTFVSVEAGWLRLPSETP
jgi:hypothetical protein